MTFHPCCLRFSCDAIMQPASTGCSSRVWVFPTSILQRKWCLYRQTHCLRALWSLSTCLPNLKIILQSGPSAFKFNLKLAVIFCSGDFCVCIRSKQGELVPTRNFLNQIFQIRLQKYLLGFAQTRYSAQNCADCASYPLKALSCSMVCGIPVPPISWWSLAAMWKLFRAPQDTPRRICWWTPTPISSSPLV